MTRVYLNPGDKIDMLTIDARVGLTGTTADLSLDWSQDGIIKRTGAEGVGSVVRTVEGYHGPASFGVHVDDESGRFWFDTDEGQ